MPRSGFARLRARGWLCFVPSRGHRSHDRYHSLPIDESLSVITPFIPQSDDRVALAKTTLELNEVGGISFSVLRHCCRQVMRRSEAFVWIRRSAQVFQRSVTNGGPIQGIWN